MITILSTKIGIHSIKEFQLNFLSLILNVLLLQADWTLIAALITKLSARSFVKICVLFEMMDNEMYISQRKQKFIFIAIVGTFLRFRFASQLK